MISHLLINSLSLSSYEAHFLELFIHLLFLLFSLSLLPDPQELDHTLSVYSGVDELSNRHLFNSCDLIFVLVFIYLSPFLCFDLICVTLFVMGLCELRVDNSQGQIKQKESSTKHEGHEEYPDDVSEALLHVSLDITPSF